MTVRNNKVMMMSNRMSSAFAISALAVSIVAVTNSAHAAQRIDNVSVVQTAPAVTQMRLGFTGLPVLPAAYQLDDPSRLVLDFEQVQNGLASRFNEYNIGAINDVTTLSSDSTTRLIVGLKESGNYTTAIEGNDLLLTITDPNRPVITSDPIQDVLNNNNSMTTTAVVTPIVESSTVPVAPVRTTSKVVVKNEMPADTMVVRVNPLLNPQLAASQVSKQYSYDGLSAVNFSAGNDGGGNVSMVLANEAIPVDVQRQGNKLVVRLTGSTVPRNLLRRLNINSGLVGSIDTKNQGQNGVITINMNDDYEYQAYQSGNQLNIGIKKPELLREPTLEERVYSGEPLSMEFQDVEVRSVLDILAQFTEMNIVASDSVAGNITLRLINVPWDQALDIILKSKNLGKRENGNVILVAPSTELAEQEARELEAQQAVQSYAPLRTEYIRLSYAKAQDVLTLISQGSGATGNSSGLANREDNNTLLSNRGTVTVDERTNTLIIKDVADSIENIHKLISKIDIPVRQVMIEARIVSATDSFSKEIGVRWGILSNGAANNRSLLVGGSNQTLADLKDFDIETTTVNGQTVSYPSYDITSPDNLNVDLGVSNPAGSIAFGLLSMSDVMLDLELSALQADNRGEVISTPKILTADKQTAKVSSGTQIPYQEASASGATTTSFKEAALSLEATPNITPDGKIGLQLVITNGTPTIINNQVAISEDSISTNVIIEDGQTVVLGGVFKNRTGNEVTKVPFLGDLPYIGRAFRKDVRSNTKEELLIFVTPKLINDGTSRLN
ncbi:MULTISPECIES: type IV pilus secretin PilQ [Psychrobacter]|jgi:type IV pilus assembly protein PilQ|uniref:type IV pilus secretin PilQ n=1 Tax=Psychrobacter TaxID=497 RepID=UPI000C33E686|nr:MULTISPECIES: type IV pilus secretin PilQ [Psychrobacter]MBA6243295.1 type IV pilus secretin PilQ [Psychrobacter sp. Urea-trap-18]MBA6285521.1 type IV pilus secretin PilQ [Psychrobacter sp. Urea-trap-16]MBA6317135.1 type IV pilus secretin PilQ [Psychrobacter sp. Urea-trap-20]MBA6333758.1 type IV pilus secretin PilQ [Psychrobacter sp. Urea-trap-19]PKG61852.1 type IV pilus secretin PilQ [Psychrobacter sp. Choline-3u-12]|tara:strand:+ start:20175 stop:22526 length:2352 start_codon:yes stop_codon:yes gene_type:complete